MAKTNKGQEQQAAQPTAKDLHARLKEIVQREIDNLPAALEELEPKERVKTLLALLPYVAPKVTNVAADYGEPMAGFDWGL